MHRIFNFKEPKKMIFKIKFFISIIALIFSSTASAIQWQDNKAITALFDKAGVTGTFVIYDISAGKLIGHNEPRAKIRFIPASTFKIPNSLIGLSTGAVKNLDETFFYSGQQYWLKAWEKDMNLREAFKLSCIPIYQTIARRVGLQRMQSAITKLDYGNKQIGTKVDEFWLEGPLAISAIEQTQFLAKLAQKTLPFPDQVQEQVHEIARLDQGNDWVLYAKTGWTGQDTKNKKGIGWWVGWVKKDSKFYTFALNIDMPTFAEGAKRIEIGRAGLKEVGALN